MAGTIEQSSWQDRIPQAPAVNKPTLTVAEMEAELAEAILAAIAAGPDDRGNIETPMPGWSGTARGLTARSNVTRAFDEKGWGFDYGGETLYISAREPR